MKIAVITGASSGIGKQFVLTLEKEYAHQLEEIWVLARRRERLEQLRREVSLPVRIFSMDLQDVFQYAEYIETLQKEKPVVKILVNGAGIGKIGTFQQISRNGNLNMIDLNCQVLTKITYDTLPFMGKGSYIVNLASASAFLPQTGFAVYAAGKSYVLNFSRALCWEEKKRGIHVMAVCPGPTDTEFFREAEEFKKMPEYKKWFLANPEKVVEKALKDLKRGKEVSVYGFSMRAVRIIAKIAPVRWILRFIN